MEPRRHGALPDHRELRVDVDGSGPGDEEEAGLEVLEVVDRERVQPLAVHGEDPAREEAGVEGEEPGRIGERRLDVAALVADDERVAVEDLDEPVVHAPASRRDRGGLGNSRCRRTSSRQSPSTARSPRSTAATAFSFPAAILSKTALSARIDAGRRGARLRADRDVALVDRDVPAPHAATVDDVEPRRAARLPQQRLVRARRELGEEGGGRIGDALAMAPP